MKTSPPFKIGVVQDPPVFLNLEASVEKACKLIEQAAGEAQVIVFPETWLPGYPVWLDVSPNAGLWDYLPAKALYRVLVENSLSIPGKAFERLLEMAGKVRTYVVMGAHELRGGTLFNTLIFIHKNGQDFKLHRKLVPTYTERMIWGRGDGSTLHVLETEFGNIGGLICWEHWMPLARAALHAKWETLHIAAWPMVKELNHLASRHYAFEGQCYVVAAGCALSKGEILRGFDSLNESDTRGRELLDAIPGKQNDLILKGGSAVIAPDGSYLEGPVYDERGVIYATIEPECIREGNLLLDTDGHYARPDVFHLEVNDRPQSNVTFTSENR